MDVYDVVRLDRTDQDVLRSYWELGERAMAELPHDYWPSWHYASRFWAQPTSESDVTVLGVRDGDRLLGGAFVGAPTRDNLHLMHVELVVDPGARRTGVGTALLRAAEDVGAAAGRTTYLTDAVVPVGLDTGALAFAAGHGYERVSQEECKVVDLAAHADALPGLEAQAAERLGDHRLVSWEAPAPEEWLDGICALRSAFLDEIPLEDVDLQPQEWTRERYRENEQRRTDAGARQLVVAAVGPDGDLVGYSNLAVSEGAEDRAEIGGTLVLPQARGHRLGLAMKVRLHQLVAQLFPGVRTVVTRNAGVNAHMNAVNEQLGYRVVQHVIGLQKRV